MPAPAVLRDVFQALRAELGEEDSGHTFDNGPGPLARLDVLVYRAAEPAGLTVFATIGMAVAPMSAEAGRAELRFARRGQLSAEDVGQLAMRLANLAAYPWTVGRPLGRGEIVHLTEDLPTFPGHRAMFLAGPWQHGQTDTFDTEAGPVQVLHVLPVTEAECASALASRPEDFLAELLHTRDVFAPNNT